MGSYHKVALSLLGLLFVGLVQAQSSPRILFMGLKTFRAGTNYEATVTSLSNQRLGVTVSILNNITRAVISTQFASISAGSQQTIALQIPETPELSTSGVYVVQVQEGNSYRNETQIQFKEKNRSLFVVTDKSIYKPGATVKFRVFAVTVQLLPKEDPITVEIFNPKGNKIKQWVNQTGASGVVSGELELSTLTTLGTWKIKATSARHMESQEFEVDEYTLPKFEVTLDLNPTFIVSSDSLPMNMVAKVTANYNIGTPVEGDLTLEVKGQRSSSRINAISVSRKIFGIQNVEITFPAGAFSYCGICPVVAEASVTDSLSGETRKASVNFQTYNTLEKLEFLPGADYIRPGLTNRFKLKLTQQDGAPLLNTNDAIEVTARESSNNYIGTSPQQSSRERKYSYPLPSTGIVTIEHPTLLNATSLTLTAVYKGAQTEKYISKQFKTRSGNNLEVEQVLLPGGQKPVEGSLIEFRIRGTENFEVLFYQILSKGVVVTSGTDLVQPADKESTLRFSVSRDMSPSATIIVYYVNAEGELIAAAERFEVTFSLNNQVTMNWDADRKKVNENVTLTVRAEPSSYVSVGAVDQSILLLGESNDMTLDRVMDELVNYEPRDPSPPFPIPFFRGGRVRRSVIWWPYSSSSNTGRLLTDSGLVYMTDAFVYNEPVNDLEILLRAGVIMEDDAAVPSSPGTGSATEPQSEVYVRTYFPESWFWLEKTTQSTGIATFPVTVPDTLTKWVATAFALHPSAGLGIPAQRANLTAFLPFFMRVDKPYSIIRGEEAEIKILVFNYLGSTRQATIELQQSQQFKVKDSMNDVISEFKTVTKTVQVEHEKGASVSIVVVPQQLGYLEFNLRAQTEGAGDALNETLLVEPEGQLVENNKAIFVSLESGTNSLSRSETVTFPLTDVVPGSKAIVISVIGDMLGTSLSGLGSLIRMPYGCGEQNMISFVPNIVVRKYLESKGRITSEQRSDTTKFMESGYQRELTYQRDEGSFSAFGNSDPAGSTWLTAFVVQSFKQAEPYIYVEDELLIKSLNWLIQRTFNRGTNMFMEVGNVIHDAMQGGSGSEKTMTAYVLIALEVCKDLGPFLDDYDNVVTNVRQTLVNIIDNTDDPYKLAIIAYALQLSNNPNVPRILGKLEQNATLDQGMKYWKLTSGVDMKSSARGPRKNNQVELASFVLLTHVLRSDLAAALPIARFLMSSKNPTGGFYSTQDTVWGLTALAEFSSATLGSGKQFTAVVTLGPNQRKEFNVNAGNAQLLQKYELKGDEISGNAIDVKVEVTGAGSGLVEIASQYYTTKVEENNRLKLTVKTKQRSKTVRELTTCVNVVDSSLKDMIVVEVPDQSDFLVDASSIQVKDNIRRVEKEGKKTSIYYGDIPPGQDQCAVIMAYQENVIGNVQAASFRAFGYYSGEKTVISFSEKYNSSVEDVTLPEKPTSLAMKSSGSIVTSLALVLAVIWMFRQA